MKHDTFSNNKHTGMDAFLVEILTTQDIAVACQYTKSKKKTEREKKRSGTKKNKRQNITPVGLPFFWAPSAFLFFSPFQLGNKFLRKCQ